MRMTRKMGIALAISVTVCVATPSMAAAGSSVVKGATSVSPEATIAEARAAAAVTASTLCAKKPKPRTARIAVTSGATLSTYQLKCAEVLAAARKPAATTPALAAGPGLAGTAVNASFPAGAPGQLAVVANGPITNNTVPVIVRNNTGRTVTDVEVQGAARDAAGALVGSGSGRRVQPAALAPGAIGIGYVAFSSTPAATQFDFTTTSKPSRGAGRDYIAGLEITESNVVQQQRYGTTTTQIVGSILNPLQGTVNGPISVFVLCLDASGNPALVRETIAEGDDLPAGATTTFAASIYDQACDSYLVGASGYNEAL